MKILFFALISMEFKCKQIKNACDGRLSAVIKVFSTFIQQIINSVDDRNEFQYNFQLELYGIRIQNWVFVSVQCFGKRVYGCVSELKAFLFVFYCNFLSLLCRFLLFSYFHGMVYEFKQENDSICLIVGYNVDNSVAKILCRLNGHLKTSNTLRNFVNLVFNLAHTNSIFHAMDP